MSAPIAETTEVTELGRSAFGVTQLQRRPGLQGGAYQIKMFADDETVVGGENACECILRIPKDLHGTQLTAIEACVTTAGGGDVTIQAHNITQAVDMLLTVLSIDSGELDSKDAATAVVIDPDNMVVHWGDQIEFNVIDDGGGALGMNLDVVFG